jgi:hypothetical protein
LNASVRARSGSIEVSFLSGLLELVERFVRAVDIRFVVLVVVQLDDACRDVWLERPIVVFQGR